MSAEKAPRSYWVFNQTRESFLSLGVSPADSWFTRLKGLAGKVRLRSDDGLWVVPSGSIHTIGVPFPIDLVYLDAGLEVIHLIERFGGFRIAPLREESASVLQLPTRTIHFSHTEVGDRLLICTQPEMESHLRQLDQAHLICQGGKKRPGGLRQWLFPSQDRRRAERRPAALVAFYWNGGPPQVHQVRDINLKGLYIYTTDRWYPGTTVMITLRERVDDELSPSSDAIAVNAKVVRHDAEGVGFQFVSTRPEEQKRLANFVKNKVLRRPTVQANASKLRSAQGNALVEYALLLPLLFLLIVNTVNFGGFFFAWITVSNAARAGVQYAIMGGASPTEPIPATPTQITSLITNDISSLLNRSSLQVAVCTNNNGTIPPSGCGGTPADPEPGFYVLTTVDVTYTYNPLIPLWEFPGLHIHATLPPMTIHRKAIMRSIQ